MDKRRKEVKAMDEETNSESSSKHHARTNNLRVPNRGVVAVRPGSILLVALTAFV